MKTLIGLTLLPIIGAPLILLHLYLRYPLLDLNLSLRLLAAIEGLAIPLLGYLWYWNR